MAKLNFAERINKISENILKEEDLLTLIFLICFSLGSILCIISLFINNNTLKIIINVTWSILLTIGSVGFYILTKISLKHRKENHNEKRRMIMAKLNLEERINKISENILKEEIKIEEAKEKIKSLNKELKALKDEKDKTYANDFLKILAESGLTSDEQKEKFIQSIQQQLQSKNSAEASENFSDNNG